MRAVVDKQHTITVVPRCPQFAPSSGDYQSCAYGFRGRENHLSQPFRVVNNNAAESDVYGSWAVVEKFCNLWVRSIIRFFAEEEPTDIWYSLSFNKYGVDLSWVDEPMKSGQSTGFGINAGDQQ